MGAGSWLGHVTCHFENAVLVVLRGRRAWEPGAVIAVGGNIIPTENLRCGRPGYSEILKLPVPVNLGQEGSSGIVVVSVHPSLRPSTLAPV